MVVAIMPGLAIAVTMVAVVLAAVVASVMGCCKGCGEGGGKGGDGVVGRYRIPHSSLLGWMRWW